MAEERPNSPGPSAEAVQERINALVHDYSNEELGAMLRAALLAQQQQQAAHITTEDSFSAWLKSVGLAAIAAVRDSVRHIFELIRNLFS